jgi:hypothetical protein
MTTQKFYMLYVLDGGKPNTVYFDFDGALARAKHLAIETRKPVRILTTTHEVTAELPPETVVVTEVEEIP